jgi:3'(2'), 5'-bisphosphate nucleotidase
MIGKEYHHLLIPSLVAAKAAGNAILDVYETSFDIETKDDRTPLTLADKQSHEIIMDHLLHISQEQLTIPILSEEGKDVPYSERKEWEDFWLVDPLDGTKEFIKRNGEFTVNIALISNNRPFMGVIYVPVQDVYYFAIKDRGSYKLTSSKIIGSKLSLQELLESSVKLPLKEFRPMNPEEKSRITIVGSRSHATKELEEYVDSMRKEFREVAFVSAGSSLKFCLVAEGKADMYPRYAPTMEWDTAAGQIIAEEGGASVIRVDNGAPLLYNKEDLKNPWFVVKADGID